MELLFHTAYHFCSSVILLSNGTEKLDLFGQGRQIWVLITVMRGCHKQMISLYFYLTLFKFRWYLPSLVKRSMLHVVAVMSVFKSVSFQLNCLDHTGFILMLKNCSVALGGGKFDLDTQFLPGFCLSSPKNTKWIFPLWFMSLVTGFTAKMCSSFWVSGPYWNEGFHPIFQIFTWKKWWNYIWSANIVQISRHSHGLYLLMPRKGYCKLEIVG